MTTSAIERLVQEAAAGRSPWKLACRLVATTNLTLQGLQTVDSVPLDEGDRILVAGQTDSTQNGIRYASAGAWIRSVDFDSDEEATLGMVINILEGSTGANTEYELTSPTSGPIVIGSTALTFQQSGAGGGVSTVHATLPLVSSGGTTPTITIDAATDSTPGSLSAADKTKIDSLDDGTISAFTSGTPTLVAKVGGRVNRLSGTASAPTLPSGPVGASVVLENIGLTSLVVSAAAGDSIDGESTYAIPDGDETANPHVRPIVRFICDAFVSSRYQWSAYVSSGSGGGVSSVTGTAPVVSSGGATPAISMPVADSTHDGYLNQTDWSTFNGKGAGTVTSVTGTAPIVSSGGTTPALSISAATTGAAGSLSASDKTKLDSMTSGAAVASVTVNAPITNSGSSTALSLHVTAADATHDGYLAQADYTTLHTATAAATNSALCQRDSSAGCAFGIVTASQYATTGNLILNPSTGVVAIDKAGASGLTISVNPTGTTALSYAAGITSITDSQTQHASAAGNPRSLYAQQGAAGFIGGVTKIGGGPGGTSGTNLAGPVQIDLGTAVSGASAKSSWLVGGASVLDLSQSSAGNLTLDAGSNGLNIVSASGAIEIHCTSSDAALVSGAASNSQVVCNPTGEVDVYATLKVLIRTPEYDFCNIAAVPFRTFGHSAAFTDTFAAANTSNTISQADTTVSTATGAPLTIAAQNSTGAGGTVGGTLFLAPGTGTTRGGNVCIGATSFTDNGMGTGLYVATATATPTAAPSGGCYLYASSGVLRAVDSGSTGNRAEDLHASFKADQTVAFVPTAVAKFRRSGSGKFTSAVTRAIVQIESAAIPQGGSIVSVGRLTIKVTAFDSTAGGCYHAIWQSGYKSIAGTLSVDTAVLVGTAIDNTSTDVTGITTTLSSGAINVNFITLKTDPIYVLIEVEVDGMRIS